jgi:gliding motility-associated lipoprotein GldH|tara:strand:- start:199 stop:711 length:513 start_codon:yes stop_codon:yes gene_type:complete
LTKKRRKKNFPKEYNSMLNRIWIIILLLNFSSCNNTEFLEFHDFKNGWDKNDILTFNFPKTIEPKTKDVFFILRHNNNYPYSNIFLITELQDPTNQVLIDTFEFKLAQANGEWLGDKKISVIEHKLLFKESLELDENDFSLKVRTSMRSNNQSNEIEKLDGVINFGILID